jgi:hypothetical protein
MLMIRCVVCWTGGEHLQAAEVCGPCPAEKVRRVLDMMGSITKSLLIMMMITILTVTIMMAVVVFVEWR